MGIEQIPSAMSEKTAGVEEPVPGWQNPKVPDLIPQLTGSLLSAEFQCFHDVVSHQQNEVGSLLDDLQESFRL